MKNKILSLSECQTACIEYNPDISYAQIYTSITFWLQKKGKKQKVNSKINKQEVVKNGRRNL